MSKRGKSKGKSQPQQPATAQEIKQLGTFKTWTAWTGSDANGFDGNEDSINANVNSFDDFETVIGNTITGASLDFSGFGSAVAVVLSGNGAAVGFAGSVTGVVTSFDNITTCF